MHWAHFLLQMMPSCLGRMALLLSVALLTVVRAGDMNEMRASSFRERHWRKRIDRAARVRTLSLSPISDSVAPRYRVGADDNSGTLEKVFTPVRSTRGSPTRAKAPGQNPGCISRYGNRPRDKILSNRPTLAGEYLVEGHSIMLVERTPAEMPWQCEKKVSCNHDETCIKAVEQQEETISLLIAGKRVLQSSVTAAFNSAKILRHPPVHCNSYNQMYANRHKGKRRPVDIKRTYARNFKSEEEKEDDESDGTSFVPGAKNTKKWCLVAKTSILRYLLT